MGNECCCTTFRKGAEAVTFRATKPRDKEGGRRECIDAIQEILRNNAFPSFGKRGDKPKNVFLNDPVSERSASAIIVSPYQVIVIGIG